MGVFQSQTARDLRRTLAITAVQTLQARPGSSMWARNKRRNPRGVTLPASASEATMRKLITWLDEEQREALLELADFGTAAFSAGLAVALLKGVVDLIALIV